MTLPKQVTSDVMFDSRHGESFRSPAVSSSFVDDMVTCAGHPNPPVLNRVFWGLSEGAAAASLRLAGGLSALRTASVSAGLPQSILLLLASYSLYTGLRRDRR